MTTETDALWAAVDSLTKPSTRKLSRDTDAEWLRELAADVGTRYCDVQAYRAATMTHGTVASLWQQAEIALTTGAESAGGHRSMLATRSPADLALMETMADIREAVSLQIQGRGEKPTGTVPAQIRHLASLVLPNAAHVEWWTYRFQQWQRILETYLRAVEQQPKPVRLRGVACEDCGATHMQVKVDGEVQIVGAIMIDFREGYVRAATCGLCGWTKWRGDEMTEWASRIVDGHPPVMNVGRLSEQIHIDDEVVTA